MVLNIFPASPTVRQILNQEAVVAVASFSIIDEDYGVEGRSLARYTLACAILPIGLNDLRFMPTGAIQVGDIRGYFMPSYTVSGTTITLTTKDIIEYSDNAYEIRSINDLSNGRTPFLKEVVGRRIQKE